MALWTRLLRKMLPEIVGEETWGAVFDVYGATISKLLETDAAGLEAMQKSRLPAADIMHKTRGQIRPE